ncbi:MAG: three-Cys-motif partner protein TcmP [Chloroflexota bacterium]|nr:three-Cys-motif partner protein TcmP [Chloroflexota bacterium]
MEYEGKSYGSGATVEKLDAHSRYADAYTNALLHQPSRDNLFTLHYVDAFAGRGEVHLPGSAEIVPGSALQALEVDNRPFDRLLFIDSDQQNCDRLSGLIDERGDRFRSTVLHGDANLELRNFCSWLGGSQGRMDRAFIFADPYAMQVEWETVKAIAATKRADLLMLFPLMSLRRNLKRDDWPTPEHQVALNRFFGGDSWKSLYSTGGNTVVREGGDREIVDVYVERMREEFAEVVDPRRTLGSASDGSLFTMVFGASNPDAAQLAARIARGVFNAASGIQGRMRLK